MASGKTALIAVVDDDESVRDSTKGLFRSAGFIVATFESGEEFLVSRTLLETDCLILDIRMTGMDGAELQRRVNASQPDVPIIFISGHGRHTHIAMKGNSIVFEKPFAAADLLAAVQTVLGSGRARRAKKDWNDLPLIARALKAVAP